MAASSSSQVFQEELKDAGERLLAPPASTPELLILLDKVELLLSRVEQAPSERTYDALLPLMKALIAPDLLRHSDIDVKVSAASCINEITRVTAPDAPYDDKQMQEIFELSVMALGKLSLASGRCYTKAVSILHNIAAVRSCLVMLDLEFDELIVEMFQLFLNTIRSDHPQSVFSDMEMIMSLVLEETEEIPLELIIPLLRSVKKGNQNISPTSWKLGENVLNKCADKLRPYLPPAVQFMGFDVGDFAEIVFSICQDASRSEHLNGLPISATGPSSSDDSLLKKASQTKGKRKRIPEKEEVPEMANGMENHGEELVWLPDKSLVAIRPKVNTLKNLNIMLSLPWFYEGAISSFDPIEKKHKVLYADGDEEMLDLSTERWMFVSKSNFSEQVGILLNSVSL
ncbi:hypothetical protein RHSIM_Rhsim08G0207000 [Rhododendron simsii]|uniref:ARM repeat superfamily protein n=1 Tax=Rhododendron simsii TaxID=118357 RepID=A0A834GKN3_RHOSS|nr:hypothetical protein RHSIM_Rhsim08G0207000 [Rhododendron simsii]